MKSAPHVQPQRKAAPVFVRAGRNAPWWPFALMAALTFLMFIDVLFQNERVLSLSNADLASQFVYWREFGFSHLRHGELPLWNPHIFGGEPFFGGFQSALLYPPNLIFLILPLGMAINWSIALHVFLVGLFTFVWIRNHVAHWSAALLAAVMIMFGGPYFLHISAGHLPNLCTMAWVPLVFFAMEKIVARTDRRSCLLGVCAISMEILAGHPQYVFYTAIAGGIYLCALLAQRRAGAKAVLALAAVGVGALLITAVQVMTGLQEATEGVRSIPLTYDFASICSFPPENLLTSIAPWFFGNLQAFPYWGRCYIFEMSVFVSVTGLVLGTYGAIRAGSKARVVALVIIAVLVILALGAHTPLFKALYNYVPGFNKFRGSSKFFYFVALWWALLAALGFDKLLTTRTTSRALMLCTVVCAVLLGGAGLWLRADVSTGKWHKAVTSIHDTGETADELVRPEQYNDATFSLESRRQATNSLFVAAATLLAIAALLSAVRFSMRAAYALLVVAALEMFVFARSSIVTFDLSSATPTAPGKVLADHPGDYRVLNTVNPNSAMMLGGADIWGYDPGPILRYVQFVAATEGVNPDKVTQDYPLKRDHPALGLVRLRYLFAQQNGQDLVGETKSSLPHVLLVGRSRLMTNRMDILATVTNANFNGRDEVILESPAQPAPEPVSSNSSVKLVNATTDTLQIEATLDKPAILLVTDAYSRFWTARSLQTSPQEKYDVLPADYCLRAVPLTAGHHLLQMEYCPPAFAIGKWISLVSVLIYIGCLGWTFYPAKRRS